MISRRTFLASAAIAATGCHQPGPYGYPGLAFVATQGSSSIAVIDLLRFSTKTRIKLDAPPTMVIGHPTEPRIYALGATNGTIYEINAATSSLNRKSKVSASAASMKLDPSGQFLWVFAPSDKKLYKVELTGLQVTGDYAFAEGAENFDISQKKGFGATSHPASGSVTLLDLDKREFTTLVRLGGTPRTVRFRSDGSMLLVANTQDRVLTTLQMPGGRVVSSLPLAVRPDYLCFNQDDGQLFITGEGADVAVVVFPYPFPEVAETVLAGSNPAAMGVSSQYLFVANPQSGDVSILDIPTRKLIAVAPVGSEPSFIVVTPRSELALVLNRRSGDVAVIRIGSIRAERDKRAPILTIIPVGTNPVSAAIRTGVV